MVQARVGNILEIPYPHYQTIPSQCQRKVIKAWKGGIKTLRMLSDQLSDFRFVDFITYVQSACFQTVKSLTLPYR